MTRTSPNFLFRKALNDLPRGTPLTTDNLLAYGLTAKHLSRLAAEGWLQRLGHGVYLLPGDKLEREAALVTLAKSIPSLHVAGKTALAWRGIRHNIASTQIISLWGEKPGKLPSWFTQAFPSHYQTTNIFDAAMPACLGLAPLPGGNRDLLVSVPERALLELLSDTGKRQGLEEARQLAESIHAPRMDVMDKLLSYLTRIKIVRMAYQFADELNLPWKDTALENCERLGGGKRWVSSTRNGERLNLKRPS